MKMSINWNMGCISFLFGYILLIVSMSFGGIESYPIDETPEGLSGGDIQFQPQSQIPPRPNELMIIGENGGKDHHDFESQLSRLPLSAVDELRMRLYLLSWLQSLAREPTLNNRIKSKRTCMVNAGLSHSCDYKNVLAAKDEGRFFTSDLSPGRK